MPHTARHRAEAHPVALARDTGSYWAAELARSLRRQQSTRRLRQAMVAVSAAALALTLVAVPGLSASAVPEPSASAAPRLGVAPVPPAVVYTSPATATPVVAPRDGYGVTLPPPPVRPERVSRPVPAATPVSSPFGPRIAPCATCSTDHRGVDLVPGDGTPVAAVADGVVIVAAAEPSSDLGVSLTVRHRIRGAWVETVYAHLAAGSMPLRVGDPVRRGQIIGSVGNTGLSTGPHLHFGVLVAGQPIDPVAWLAASVAE